MAAFDSIRLLLYSLGVSIDARLIFSNFPYIFLLIWKSKTRFTGKKITEICMEN